MQNCRISSFDGVFMSYLRSLDCPRALTIWIMYSSGEHKQLAELECRVCDYDGLDSFHAAYLATSFLSKWSGLSTGKDLEAEAFASFLDAEQRCSESNDRLERLDIPERDVLTVLYRAREKISRLLGDRSVAMEEIISLCRFGPGVTTTCKGAWTNVHNKLRSLPECTPLFDRVFSPAYNAEVDYPDWSTLPQRRHSPGNTITFVPKNAKTHRTIAVEPILNAFFQRGVGEWLQKRLYRWGVNLRDQTKNQELAREGSLTDQLATLDLKAASDSLCKEAVRLLLPAEWVALLETLRSPAWRHPYEKDKWVKYHKHSSMGNGYTFELESLIFSALCASLPSVRSGGRWSVYGDDIIIPSSDSDLLIRALSVLGFTVNSSKSFTAGPFRESCGKHYYNGRDVTPFYYKKEDIIQMVEFANWLRESAPFFIDITVTWKKCYFSVPKEWALKKPAGCPGVGFVVNEHELITRYAHRYGRFGCFVDTMMFTPRSTSTGVTVGGTLACRGESSFAIIHRGTREGLYLSEPPLAARRVARRLGKWKRTHYFFTEEWKFVRSI